MTWWSLENVNSIPLRPNKRNAERIVSFLCTFVRNKNCRLRPVSEALYRYVASFSEPRKENGVAWFSWNGRDLWVKSAAGTLTSREVWYQTHAAKYLWLSHCISIWPQQLVSQFYRLYFFALRDFLKPSGAGFYKIPVEDTERHTVKVVSGSISMFISRKWPWQW